ncbi:RraA family protein [Mesorhizobium sp. M8A.F.Ca.ET.202.01.1.1]|nr:RraA family protein [Mesorhizobium sp. M8A.F.Ca.ET.197.01.1.1]TGR32459.1 RraA family protein [Mesorhizobium sp. M8A.F.Ca.ET.202.01.1.1]TGR43729.1 RraA family protein [bacterium M00.F.Ca.ET.199.01.1.1]TGR53033.1 RraA family protein [Mesorhizobium sp. M8A.F.Ca.ET.198.01.1.1]TGU40338.1 RraA family protein [bacterium M00.F.Ca.ET.156.01.1.1]TGV86874.1 RraA family protein [Mesorhizobium sp. M00.F.Ca.ET.149.01.1.1]
MRLYGDDAEMYRLFEAELFVAVVGDVMDTLGLQHQFLPPVFKPVDDKTRLLGRAMPVLETDIFLSNGPTHNPLMTEPFGLMFEALDDLKPGEIYVASGASPRYALWGELMSTRAKILGAHGALVDGFARDTDGIKALGFPCFCTGYYAQDQGVRGKVIDYRCTLEIGGVRIEPGTLLFGDKEGVIVIPRQAEEEVVRLALEKVRGEKLVAKAIREGMSAVEAYRTFGIM